ncbi:MAG: ribosomal-processing cysteine protease Prp [Spirochaetia bacterium]
MVRVCITLSRDSALKSIRATGHAGAWKNGGDPACSAVSVLLKTLAMLITGRFKKRADFSAQEEGEYFLVVHQSVKTDEWLLGVTDFIVTGLYSIEKEYPGTLLIDITDNKSEDIHGT